MSYDKYKKLYGRNSAKSLSEYVDDDSKTSEEHEKELENGQAGSLEELSEYVKNENKTIDEKTGKRHVMVLNCTSPDTFTDDCKAAEKLYHSHKKEHLKEGEEAVEMYHFIQSFKGKPDPDIATQAGVDLAKELAGSGFAAEVCTHFNTNNTHNHIIINAYSNDGTRKFKDEFHMYKKVRDISNQISLQYGLDIIESKGKSSRSWAEVLDERNNDEIKTYKKLLKNDINDCEKMSDSYETFREKMSSLGYEMKTNGSKTSYIKDGRMISDYSLGTRYMREGIEEDIAKNVEKKNQNEAVRQIKEAQQQRKRNSRILHIRVPKYTKSGHRIPAIFRLLILVKEFIKAIGNLNYDENLAKSFPENTRMMSAEKKIERIDRTIEICREYHIETLDGLEEMRKTAGMNEKTLGYQAADLYALSDKMQDIIDLLSLEDELKTVMTSLGIEDEQMRVPVYSERDKKVNLASLEPATGKQKKQLFNALKENPEYRLNCKFDEITKRDARDILSFLNNPKEKTRPALLLTSDDYSLQKAHDILSQKSKEKINTLEEKYGNEPASDKQMRSVYAVDSEVPESFSFTKAEAMRILNRYSPAPRYKETFVEEKNRPTKWMVSTLNDIKKIYPEYEHLNTNKIDKNTANNIINWALAQEDDVESILYDKVYGVEIVPEEEKKEMKPINFNDYSEEERLCILQYKDLLDIKAKYGLDTPKKVRDFIQKQEDTLAEADKFMIQSRECADTYSDLSFAYGTLKNSLSVPYIYGPLAKENDIPVEVKEMMEEAAMNKKTEDKLKNLSYNIDRLSELNRKLDGVIEELDDSYQDNEELGTGNYIPLSPETVLYLSDIRKYVPEEFPDKETSHLTGAEAKTILHKIKDEDTVGKLLADKQKEELALETEEEREETMKNAMKNISENSLK